jgi:multimeric flavodoxin WrbA
MRKILGISASARVWGNCDASVKQVLAAASQAGARTSFIRLSDRDIRPCQGCFRCLRESRRCPVDDDLYALLDEVAANDDIVLASPVYFLSAPATLVGLMDRLLTIDAYVAAGGTSRRAVTLTLMGNNKWRGVAEPFVNLTASLLGFEIAASLSLVAEGPGEVVAGEEICETLAGLGRALAGGELPSVPARKGVCPVCRSDFFHVVPPAVICPVCGLRGDLAAYTSQGVFAASGDPPRWGRRWLAEHIDSWIRPSLERFSRDRRNILRKVHRLKKQYRDEEERGNPDVH